MNNKITKRNSGIGNAILSEAESRIQEETKSKIIDSVVIIKRRIIRKNEEIQELKNDILILTTLVRAFEGGHFEITPIGKVLFPDSVVLQQTFDRLQ